jgi:hypothetical protein
MMPAACAFATAPAISIAYRRALPKLESAAGNHLVECFPGNVFHYQEVDSIPGTYVMQGHDVWMIQRGDCLCLLKEAVPAVRVASSASRKDLKGHQPS